MAEDIEKRNEEQQVMEEFDSTISARFSQQLEDVAHALQLDYVTIDCTVSSDGDLVIFEVDSRGVIHAADPVNIYPYKPAVMQKAFDAFQRLLLKRSGFGNC